MIQRSENINELAAALAKAQGEMHNAPKDKKNEFFKGAGYASLASMLEVMRGPLSKHGLSVVQLPFEDEKGRISLQTMLLHASGQFISAMYCLQPSKNDLQGVGSAVTYMRKYSLQGLGIAPEDDDDGNAAADRPLPLSTPYTPNPAPRNGNGDSKAPAVRWCKDAVDTIRSFKDMADLSAWEARNEKAIQRLSEADSRLHDELLGAMADKYAVLSPLAAG